MYCSGFVQKNRIDQMSVKEEKLLDLITGTLSRSKDQLNGPNESDSELVRLEAANYAINIDEYSGSEDYFSEFDPSILGWNLVVATISDLLATGAVPKYFLHSMVLGLDNDDDFCSDFIKGVNEALNINSCFLLGGDTSTSESWRYTGVALGTFERKLMRVGGSVGDKIYSTGLFGAGNRQGILHYLLRKGQLPLDSSVKDLATPKFPSRLRESKIISKYATFAMDTSDGAINTLRTLAKLNSDCKIVSNISSQLLDSSSTLTAEMLGINPMLFLFGTLGEYELIFGISENDEQAFLEEMNKEGHVPISLGEIEKGEGLFLNAGQGEIEVGDGLPDPRSLPHDEYIKALSLYLEKVFS